MEQCNSNKIQEIQAAAYSPLTTWHCCSGFRNRSKVRLRRFCILRWFGLALSHHAVIHNLLKSSLPGWLIILAKPLCWRMTFSFLIQWDRIAALVLGPARLDHVIDLTQTLLKTGRMFGAICNFPDTIHIMWSPKRFYITFPDLWGAWVEVVAESRCRGGSGLCIVLWNVDGVVAQPPLARRWFQLLGIWRQRRCVYLHKRHKLCVRKNETADWNRIINNLHRQCTFKRLHLLQVGGQAVWQSAPLLLCRPHCKR